MCVCLSTDDLEDSLSIRKKTKEKTIPYLRLSEGFLRLNPISKEDKWHINDLL